MADAFFHQLAASDIPPVPDQLDEQVHRRLNTALLATHLFDFMWRALPYAFVTMLGSVVHFLAFTTTGQLKEDDNGRSRKQP